LGQGVEHALQLPPAVPGRYRDRASDQSERLALRHGTGGQGCGCFYSDLSGFAPGWASKVEADPPRFRTVPLVCPDHGIREPSRRPPVDIPRVIPYSVGPKAAVFATVSSGSADVHARARKVSAAGGDRSSRTVCTRPYDDFAGDLDVPLLLEHPERKCRGDGHGPETVYASAEEAVEASRADRLPYRDVGHERRSGEAVFGKLHSEARKTAGAVRDLVADPHFLSDGDRTWKMSLDAEPSNHLFGKPSAHGDEAEHGAQEKVEEVVARVHGRESHREQAQAEGEAA